MWQTIINYFVGAACGGIITFTIFIFKYVRSFKDGLLAILHDRLYQLAILYLTNPQQGLTVDEFDNLDHIYKAYHSLGGNGTGTKLYNQCCKMSIKN